MAKSTTKTVQPVAILDRKEKYWAVLNQILDPDLDIGIVDLGLVYQIHINDEGFCTVYMTLTSPSCPFGPQIIMMVEDSMRTYPGVTGVMTEIVWNPIWTQDRIDPEIRELMWGI
ncbi:metal-sulfur cluster assembly factor [Candidatus Gracilibacteria bacterium]|nr:metal-sulfur cluster assembly factor [Candidatus Gracilibacteria bacterium]